eukprot:6369867-Prorocentrum_lima.AAC.1
MLHRITKGDLMPLQAQQRKQLLSPNVAPAPTVERREEGRATHLQQMQPPPSQHQPLVTHGQ